MRFVNLPSRVRGGPSGGVVYDGKRVVAKFRSVAAGGYIARLEGAAWIDARSDPERVALINPRQLHTQTMDPVRYFKHRRQAVAEMKRIARTGQSRRK